MQRTFAGNNGQACKIAKRGPHAYNELCCHPRSNWVLTQARSESKTDVVSRVGGGAA